MPALAGTGIKKDGLAAGAVGEAGRAAIGAAPVMAAINGEAMRNALDPGEAAFREAIGLGTSGGLAE